MQSNQQQVQMQEVLQNLDENTIYQCLEAIHTAANEQIRKNADQYLMSLEEHPQFSLILISIFEKAQIFLSMQTSLKLLQSVCQFIVHALCKEISIQDPFSNSYALNLIQTMFLIGRNNQVDILNVSQKYHQEILVIKILSEEE
ncbi:hypothetical protein ABPG73_007713, partial [Tetrahymena malaccensis]